MIIAISACILNVINSPVRSYQTHEHTTWRSRKTISQIWTIVDEFSKNYFYTSGCIAYECLKLGTGKNNLLLIYKLWKRKSSTLLPKKVNHKLMYLLIIGFSAATNICFMIIHVYSDSGCSWWHGWSARSIHIQENKSVLEMQKTNSK